ncbi:MAG: hypothetical protein KGO49_08975 [Gammaproteobacteria bacterium]|nr:hypothetical protein [Gammaproteobacteria bacterium]
MSPSLLLSIHLFAVAFWFGVLGVEFILEQGRTRNRDHGYTVADIHFKIDMFLEMPAFAVVLITGLMMLDPSKLSGLYLLKVIAGSIAVSGNIYCLYPILKRKLAANKRDFESLVRYSRVIDNISLVAIPAGLVALFCGFYLVR